MVHDPSMFRALFDTAPDAMVVVDRNAQIVLANPMAVALFGYAGDDLLGQPIEVLMPEGIRRGHAGHREAYMRNPRVRPMGANLELVGMRRDGQEFPVEIALSPIRSAVGDYFAASIRDISETRRVQQALLRARFDAALAQVGQLVLESRLDNALDQLPALVAQALQVSAVAILFAQGRDRELRVQSSQGLDETALDTLCQTLAQPQVQATPAVAGAATIALQMPDGSAGLAAPLFDLATRMGWLAVLDASPQRFDRDAAHFLQAVANVLAAAVQRSRTEEQLAHAQRLEAVGQLTGGIAHDFNNLLTVIAGNLQLLEDEVQGSAGAEHAVDRAMRAVGRGAELTRKLLAFAGRQSLSPQAVKPRQILDELGGMLARTLGEQVDVRIDCADGLPEVYADPTQLESALLNLALNARDAMPRGGQLRISADLIAGAAPSPGSALPTSRSIGFVVQDSGVGMAPDTLARAFEPFFTTKPPGKGSGLGLSMVYGFVTQSGGHLSVESQLGFGTRIALYLPVARPAAAVATPTRPVAAAGCEQVLVVEDEPDVREIAVAFLRSLGYVVHAVASADEALRELAARDGLDLLFSDVILGSGLSGDELARTARRQRPGLAVLLTSGYERSSGESARITDEFELLRKPYRREQLAAAARRVLDARRPVEQERPRS